MTRGRYKPYPAYRDSGVEWLGAIPSHWEAVRMWQISNAVSGATPAKDERRYWDGQIPWVSPKDMKRRYIDSAEDRITERAIEETNIKLIQPPAVLVVVRGMILAHSFPVAITMVPVTVNQDMKALRLRQDVEPEFMAWVLEGVGRGLLSAVVDAAAHGTKAIRMDRWRTVTVALPAGYEQAQIAAFLDRETAKIDALVAAKERLIELLREKRTALITQAVTKGLDPDVPMKDSGVEWLGEIPAHWAIRANGQIFRQRDERGRDDLPILEVSIAVGVRVRDFSDSKIEQRSEDLNVYKVALIGDVAFNKMRMWQGAVGIVPEDGLVSPDYVVASPNLTADSAFFGYLYRTPIYNAEVRRWSHGIVDDRNRLYWDSFKAICSPVPPREEQQTIVAYLDRETAKLDDLIDKVQQAIALLKERRTALISAAVTGKIDVREEVEAA